MPSAARLSQPANEAKSSQFIGHSEFSKLFFSWLFIERKAHVWRFKNEMFPRNEWKFPQRFAYFSPQEKNKPGLKTQFYDLEVNACFEGN